MSSGHKILMVDDDPVLLDLHSAYLEDKGYEIVTAVDGMDAVEKVMSGVDDISLIISDVSMPNMDGYALCEKLKADSATAHLPVIFVSALSSLEEKLKGYAVGADDYIIKPVDEKEIYEKTKTLIDRQERINELNKSAIESQSMAMQAMTFSSELGQVIDFYKRILSAENYDELAKILFEITSQYDLVCTVQIYTPSNILNLSSEGVVSPLESNVIELARKKERFFDFGARTIINYEEFSLLIKNMPLEDQEKYGRVKDILGMLANGLEAKIKQLNGDVLAEKRQEIIKSIQNSLLNIEKSFEVVQKENITAIEDMNQDIKEAILILGLMEYQEENIQSIVDKCLERINDSFYKGMSINENISNLNRQFKLVLGA